MYDPVFFFWKQEYSLHAVWTAYVDDFIFCDSKNILAQCNWWIEEKIQI